MEINPNEDNIIKTYMKESRKKYGSRWKTCENQKKPTCEIYRRQMKIDRRSMTNNRKLIETNKKKDSIENKLKSIQSMWKSVQNQGQRITK